MEFQVQTLFFLQMYDEPPPRPFHTFKFPHITVEVETTPQLGISWYLWWYDVCIMVSYIMKSYIILSYKVIYFSPLLLWEQNWIPSESKFYWFCFRLWGTKGSTRSEHTSWFWKMMILPLKEKELISAFFSPVCGSEEWGSAKPALHKVQDPDDSEQDWSYAG